MRRCVLALLAGLVLPPWMAAAQDTQEEEPSPPQTLEELSERIAKIAKEEEIVGLSAALVDADGVFWAEGFGLADREAGKPLTADTPMRAGSISKSITGLLAMHLVEEGRLDLNAPLRTVAPEVEFTNRWAEEEPVRLVHLLEHTAGWDDIHPSEYLNFPDGTKISDGLAVNPASRTVRWRPGLYPSYANSGPAVVGHVIEKLTGEDFADLAGRMIFDPLELKTATFRQTRADIARVSKSYGVKSKALDYTRIWAAPSGSLAISARELGEIVRLYIRRGEVDGVRILSPQSISRIETPQTPIAARKGLEFGYGLGNYATYILDTEYHGHAGGIDGFIAFYGYRKDAPVGLVVMSNSGGMGVRDIAGLLAAYLETRHPKPPPAEAVEETDLKVYEGLYRQFTPRNEMIRLFADLFDFISVRAEGNSLWFRAGLSSEEAEYIPLGGRRFAKAGRAAAHRIFYEGPTGELELYAGFNATYRPADRTELIARAGFVALTALMIVLALLATLIWAVGRPFGAFRGARRWRVWIWPMLSILVLFAVVGAAAYAVGGDTIALLGQPTPLARTIQWGTIAMPLLALSGLLAAIRATGTTMWARWHAGLTSTVLLGFSAYLAAYGWIGITVWAYQPMVVGQ